MAKTRTKSLKNRRRLLRGLSLSLNFVPVCAFVIPAFIQGETKSKIVLGATVFVTIAFVIIGALNKHMPRSTVWILLLGILFCLKDIAGVVALMGITTIADELVVAPAIKKLNTKIIVRKEMKIDE